MELWRSDEDKNWKYCQEHQIFRWQCESLHPHFDVGTFLVIGLVFLVLGILFLSQVPEEEPKDRPSMISLTTDHGSITITPSPMPTDAKGTP